MGEAKKVEIELNETPLTVGQIRTALEGLPDDAQVFVGVAGHMPEPVSGAEVANAFMAWAAKNEIAEPPLDWAWFGEIARRYSPLHEGHADA